MAVGSIWGDVIYFFRYKTHLCDRNWSFSRKCKQSNPWNHSKMENWCYGELLQLVSGIITHRGNAICGAESCFSLHLPLNLSWMMFSPSIDEVALWEWQIVENHDWNQVYDNKWKWRAHYDCKWLLLNKHTVTNSQLCYWWKHNIQLIIVLFLDTTLLSWSWKMAYVIERTAHSFVF